MDIILEAFVLFRELTEKEGDTESSGHFPICLHSDLFCYRYKGPPFFLVFRESEFRTVQLLSVCPNDCRAPVVSPLKLVYKVLGDLCGASVPVNTVSCVHELEEHRQSAGSAHRYFGIFLDRVRIW